MIPTFPSESDATSSHDDNPHRRSRWSTTSTSNGTETATDAGQSDTTTDSRYYAAIATAPPTAADFERAEQRTPRQGNLNPFHYFEKSEDPPSFMALDRAGEVVLYDGDGNERKFKSFYTGNEHAGQRCFFVFIRHFYCQTCQYYLNELRQTVPPFPTHAHQETPTPTQVIVIGCGSPKLIKAYTEKTKSPFSIYSDPSLRLYKLLGCRRWTGFNLTPGRPDYLKDHSIPSLVGGALYETFSSAYVNDKELARREREREERRRVSGGREGAKSPEQLERFGPDHPLYGINRLRKNVAQRLSLNPLRGGPFLAVGGEFLFEDGRIVWCHRMYNMRHHAEIKTVRKVLGMVPVSDIDMNAEADGEITPRAQSHVESVEREPVESVAPMDSEVGYNEVIYSDYSDVGFSDVGLTTQPEIPTEEDILYDGATEEETTEDDDQTEDDTEQESDEEDDEDDDETSRANDEEEEISGEKADRVAELPVELPTEGHEVGRPVSKEPSSNSDNTTIQIMLEEPESVGSPPDTDLSSLLPPDNISAVSTPTTRTFTTPSPDPIKDLPLKRRDVVTHRHIISRNNSVRRNDSLKGNDTHDTLSRTPSARSGPSATRDHALNNFHSSAPSRSYVTTRTNYTNVQPSRAPQGERKVVTFAKGPNSTPSPTSPVAPPANTLRRSGHTGDRWYYRPSLDAKASGTWLTLGQGEWPEDLLRTVREGKIVTPPSAPILHR